MKKLLAILLVCGMLFAFAGCGDDDSSYSKKDKDDDTKSSSSQSENSYASDEERIIGEWTITIPAEDAVDMMDLGSDISTDGLKDMKGVFYIDIDEKELTFKLDTAKCKKWMKDAVETVLSAELEEMADDMDMTVEELLEEEGFGSIDDVVEAYMEEMDMDVLAESLEKTSAEYEIKDGRLYIHSSGDTVSAEYNFKSDDKLELDDFDGDSADEIEILLGSDTLTRR